MKQVGRGWNLQPQETSQDPQAKRALQEGTAAASASRHSP